MKQFQLWVFSPSLEKSLNTLWIICKGEQNSIFPSKKKLIDKSRLVQSTTASIEVLYAKAMSNFLEEMPHRVYGMYHSCQWNIAKKYYNATLQLFSKYTTVSSEYCID